MPRIEPIPWEALNAEQREMMRAGMNSGAHTNPLPLQILAYADHEAAPPDGDRNPNFPKHVLGGKLLEMLRIGARISVGAVLAALRARSAERASKQWLV